MLHVLGTDTENSGSHKKEVFGVCHKRKAMTAATNKYTTLIKGFKMTGRKSESCLVFWRWCYGMHMLEKMMKMGNGRHVWEKEILKTG